MWSISTAGKIEMEMEMEIATSSDNPQGPGKCREADRHMIGVLIVAVA
jgi:hypothetical protein